MLHYYLSLFIFLIGGYCYSQVDLATITGRATSVNQQGVSDIYLFFKNTDFYTKTDEQGKYSLQVPAGTYTLVCRGMGYMESILKLTLNKEEVRNLDFVLVPNKDMVLNEIEIIGRSALENVKETAYNVVAFDTKGLYNTTSDISSILDRASGVKIRRLGGLGSDVNISLNGFSGKHVKVFMDGVPMSGFGSAFQINNIPVNIAQRIEVYKGVVPIALGADALGGAINIITNKQQGSYLDASYSYASFNTHKTHINLGHTSKSGFTVHLNVFQNYSDNSYKVKTNLLNLNTNVYETEEKWFKRFHDTYRNETLIGKAGFVNKSWTDRFLVGVTLGQEHADIQNANLMKIVYGGKKREATSLIPSLEYTKKDLFIQGLKLSVMGNYSQVRNKNIDTLARQYNWLGKYREKTSKGESQYSLGKFKNNTATLVSSLSYKPNSKHNFALNNTYAAFERKFSDPVASSENISDADTFKRKDSKNILGGSYSFTPTKAWNNVVFAKYYSVNVTGPIDVSETSTPKYVEQERSFNATGYGLASTYSLTHALQLKASFEKTYRLPTINELFGDEILEVGDASLKAENSRNINFNISYNYSLHKTHGFYADLGLIYRDTKDYIRRQIEQRFGGAYYTNHGKVQTLGADFEARYYYKDKFSIGGSLTYQKLENLEKYSTTGQTLIYYKDRIPNVPYFFGNAEANYYFNNVLGKQNNLSVGYAMQYVHEFFRQWESEGAANSKKVIPGQVSHDLSLTYSLKDGRYNISLEAKNITDEMLIDNYSLQKPGRSFAIKIRYFIDNNSNKSILN